MAPAPSPEPDAPFRDFVRSCRAIAMEGLADRDRTERIGALMRTFIAAWRMPDARFRRIRADAPYASYLLYGDAHAKLFVVQDIFAPGQAARVHNHTIWGVIGCVEGCERELRYEVPADLGVPPRLIGERLCPAGAVITVVPARGDFHEVRCEGRTPSISLHIYGADIGRLERTQWDTAAKGYRSFTSGYDNAALGVGTYLERL